MHVCIRRPTRSWMHDYVRVLVDPPTRRRTTSEQMKLQHFAENWLSMVEHWKPPRQFLVRHLFTCAHYLFILEQRLLVAKSRTRNTGTCQIYSMHCAITCSQKLGGGGEITFLQWSVCAPVFVGKERLSAECLPPRWTSCHNYDLSAMHQFSVLLVTFILTAQVITAP